MYRIADNGKGIIRLSDGAYIPPDPSNSDYAAYLAWVASGNIAEPAANPAPEIDP